MLAPETPEVEAVYRAVRRGASVVPTASWIARALGRIVFSRRRGAARPRGDRPSGRPAAHPRGDRARRSVRRPGRRDRGDQARRGRARRAVRRGLAGRPATRLSSASVSSVVVMPRTTPPPESSAQGDLVERLRTRATRVVDTSGDPASTRRTRRRAARRGDARRRLRSVADGTSERGRPPGPPKAVRAARRRAGSAARDGIEDRRDARSGGELGGARRRRGRSVLRRAW